MATVIDSLVLELGIDPRKFTEGQKRAVEGLRGLEEQMRRSGNAVESNEKKTAHFFTSLKQGITGLVAGYTANRLLGFVEDLNRTDAALGRTSRTLGMSVREVAAWEGALQQSGGTAQDARSALQGLTGAIQHFQLTGRGEFVGTLNQIGNGISHLNADGQLKTAAQLFLEISEAVQGMDPGRAKALLSMLPGMNEELINLLLRGRQAVEGLLDASRRNNNVTEEGTRRSEEYIQQLGRMETAWNSLKRAVIQPVTPYITRAMELLTMSRSNRIDQGEGVVKSIDEFLRGYLGGSGAGPASVAYTWLRGQFGGVGKVGTGTTMSRPAPALPAGRAAPAAAVPRVGLTRADRNNNPGNIEYGEFARRHGATGNDGRFAIFPDRETGFRAAEALMMGPGYRNLTLDQIGRRWAEGDTNWARNASQATGLPTDRVLTDAERRRVARIGTVAAEGSALGFNPPAAAVGAGGAGPGGSVVTNSTTIGSIVVHAPGANAEGVAQGIGQALRRENLAAPANMGQQ
jgi:hypothetical protein